MGRFIRYFQDDIFDRREFQCIFEEYRVAADPVFDEQAVVSALFGRIRYLEKRRVFVHHIHGDDLRHRYEPFESAELDGAGKLAKVIYITLPSLATTISINLILQLSNVLNGGFDQIYNLDSTGIYFDIIDTYLYRKAFSEGANYSLATVLGLFKSVIGFVLIIITNAVANKLGDAGIW